MEKIIFSNHQPEETLLSSPPNDKNERLLSGDKNDSKVSYNSFFSREELLKIGFKQVGINVKISRKASFYAPNKISIGNNVRIDDFCILSGNITIGNYIHIAAYSALYGGDAGIVLDDFVNISSRVCIYSVSDDYSGKSMTNPMLPDNLKEVVSQKVHLKKHVIIGSTSVVLPGAILEEGSAFGSFSLINHSSEPWSINIGIPFKKIRNRSKNILNIEREHFINGVLKE